MKVKGTGLLLITAMLLFVFSGASVFHVNLTSLSVLQPSSAVVFNPFTSSFQFQWNVGTSVAPAAQGWQGTSPVGPIQYNIGSLSNIAATGQEIFPSPNWGATISDTYLFTPIGMSDITGAICWQQGGTQAGAKYCAAYVIREAADISAQNCDSLIITGATSVVGNPPTGCNPTGSYGASISHGDLTNLRSGTAQWANDQCSVDPCTWRISRTVTAGSQNVNQTFYLSRMQSFVQLSVTPSITLTCIGNPGGGPPWSWFTQLDTGWNTWKCPAAADESQTCFPVLGCLIGTSLDQALQALLGAKLNVLNANSLIVNSNIGLRFSVTPQMINSLCTCSWFGVYGVWTGGMTNQATGICASICTTGLSDHSTLGIYTDPADAVGAQGTFTNLGDIKTYSLGQLLNIIPASAHSTIYTSLPVSKFGWTYSISNTCTVLTLQSCFNNSGSATLYVPLLVDIIGSSSVVSNSPNPPGGLSFVAGKVQDGNSLLCGIGSCGPLAGVTVTEGPICNTPGCVQISAVTASDGSYTIGPLSAGTGSDTLWFYKNLYQQGSQTVALTQGQTVQAPTIVLSPTAPPGSTCLIGPINNPLPGQPPITSGICPPTWVVLAIFVFAGLLLAFTIFLVVPSRRKFGFGAGRVSGSI